MGAMTRSTTGGTMNGDGHQTFDLSDPQTRERALSSMLAWYRAMGVDVAVAAHATNWLERGGEPPQRFAAPPKATAAEMRGTDAAAPSRTLPRPPAPIARA